MKAQILVYRLVGKAGCQIQTRVAWDITSDADGPTLVCGAPVVVLTPRRVGELYPRLGILARVCERLAEWPRSQSEGRCLPATISRGVLARKGRAAATMKELAPPHHFNWPLTGRGFPTRSKQAL